MDDQAQKAGFAALIGRPNVGKSTLMNRMIGQKIAITSPKPQTTRDRIRTVYTDDRGQIVFVDTPGIFKAKNRLGEYMMTAAKRTLSEADIILWLVEADTVAGKGDRFIASQLSAMKVPVILVINKTDTKKREEIFAVIDEYRTLGEFAEVVPVSALKGENVDVLIEQIFRYLPEAMPYFDEDTVTDQPVRQIIAEIIREKALKCLGDEIPHGIAVMIESMKKTGKITHIDATVVCEKESHKGMIIGKGGEMIKKIGSTARYEIEKLIEGKADLQLWIKVKKDWRDSDVLLKNFGYDAESIDK